jgi:hypothetical protein
MYVAIFDSISQVCTFDILLQEIINGEINIIYNINDMYQTS